MPSSTPFVLTLTLALATALAACTATANPPAAARKPSALPNVSVLPQPLAMPGLDRERTLRVYVPPGYAASPQKRYPVLYMHDGQNLFDDATSYVGEWGIDETMDELTRTTGFEAIVVGIDHGNERRMAELDPWPSPGHFAAPEGEAYMAFVVDTVKPWIDAHYRTRPGREDTAILGSSMGGLISDYAIHRYPQVFSKAGVFSPSYWIANPAAYNYARAHPLPADARVYLYIGGREGDESIADATRMQAVLGSSPQALTLHVVPEAEHNEKAWRPEFARAVRWLFQLPN